MCYMKVYRPAPTAIFAERYRPDVGLLTSEPAKHDVALNPRIIAPDPFASDDCLDVLSPEHQLLLTTIEDENTMNTSEDEPSSGLNGRLRPRRSTVTSPHTNKATRKSEPKTATDRQKRTSTPSKAPSTKPDDLANKSDSTSTPQLLCPYCDRKFASKQTLSQHARRAHLSKPDALIGCLFCNHAEADAHDIIRHTVDSHPNQYFACLDCHTRFPSTTELAEHKLNVCEKQKVPYRSKLRQKVSSGAKKTQKSLNIDDKGFRSDGKDFPDGHRFNGVVIACELKPALVSDEADIEDNITTNLILPPSKNLGSSSSMEKNAVIMLDDIQWNKRMPTNFSFHNTDADQILSRLGVVHRSPRAAESTKKDWFKCAEEATQKFEKCFDTGFYSKVASNVHENMSKFLDGSFNFNPDPDSIIKTRKSKYSVPINAAEGFPILLACEQYSRSVFDGYMPRAIAPKHKWKWENEKAPLNPDDIKHDTHVNNCIITLVSSLDIWTQLCMRRKFEDKFSIAPLEKKTEKQNTISKELKEILESRELPSSSQQVVKFVNKPMPAGDSLDFPATLGLQPAAPTYDVQPAVLSGEWVRPRCYVCCACGAQTRDSRGLSSHISTQHPNAQVQHYEIVGELLLNADILKHLYVPPSQMSNRTRPLRGFRECTKCKKSISLEDLHQHMLDCAGDTPAVRRKVRYRPFGVRRRRTRLPDNTIRKKIRKDIRTRQTRQKTHMRSRPKIRTEVGDAETIRKMLADLPAKRHRVLVNPINSILRPRRKLDKQRNKLIMKRRSSDILKNRTQRNLKGNSLSRTRSNAGDNNDNDTKNQSKSDDDNKPLKPKVKTLKIKRSTRQSEALKRQVALNRAKRRAQFKEQKATEEKPEEPAEASASASGGQLDQLSIDNTPQRIDVSGGPYNTREHSSRGRSNNRDDQRPGPSSQDGNTHSSYNPPQNVPLKHSIARLTADSDMHDKNMQFHHLHLMPPECNEVTQHVPTGQQRLFENEAVVTKLDKPPLHFSPTGPVDPYVCQKSKQCSTSNNKRKGLNDCIAMLKNKAGQTQETSEPAPGSSDDRSSADTVATNQISPNSDLQMNVNYDTNTRPAEVFSRHQFIPDTFIEYRPENNLIAQNFADLPFHYLQSQRLPFDLLQPDTRIDPRFIKPAKQKQNEATPKTTRRRSTRAEKEQMKKQEFMLRTSPAPFPVNVSTPSKVGAPNTRRASTQSVAVSTNAAVNKRRSSVSYNQTRKTANDYRTEAMLARQRPLEYLPHQMSPEARLMELNQTEAYIEAQKNFQKQMIACAENYINKKQLAISVDTNYTAKKPNTLSPEAIYMASKQATSPGSNYINKKQAAVGSDGSHMSKHNLQQETTVEPSYMKKKQATNAKEANYHPKKSPVTNLDTAYNKAYAAASLETDLISKAQAASYIAQAKALTAENLSMHKGHTLNENFLNKSPVMEPEGKLTNRAQPLPLTEGYVSPVAQNISGTNNTAKQQVSVATDTNLTPKASLVEPEETTFITKKRAATTESSLKKQLVTSDVPVINKPVTPAEINFVSKKQAAASDVMFVNKKQAIAVASNEANLSKNIATASEIDLTNKKTVPTSESNFINNSLHVPATASNISPRSEKKSSDIIDDHVYPESQFKSIPTNIPPAYQPATLGQFQSSSQMIEAPLDLSKSTSKDNPELSEKDDAAYDTDNFDNYETLDLSHKISEHEHDEGNDVVDLRVKINTPTRLDMNSKLPICEDSATDLSIKHLDDTPTDLSVRKQTNEIAYEYDSRNTHYEEEFVQDLRKTQPAEHPMVLSSNMNDNIPTDLSGRIRDLPVHTAAYKSLTIQTHMDNALERVGSLKPADLTVREKLNQNDRFLVTPNQNTSPMISPVLKKQNHQSQGNNVVDCVLPKIVDESPYASKSFCNVNVNHPMFTTPMTPPIASIAQGSIVAGTVRPPNAVVGSNLNLPLKKQIEDGLLYNTSSMASTSPVPNNFSTVSNTISPSASSTQMHTISNTIVPLLTSKYECTTPVYTLANSCVSMTRIGLSSAAPLTETPSSVPPKMTVASAAPVYTLTDATINPTGHHGPVLNKSSNEALSATIQSMCESQIPTDLNASTEKIIPTTSGLQTTKTSAQEQKQVFTPKTSDLDPETAKKIAMLPKELVEILGTMPVDHRNQLLNVLPQYVSTPAQPSQNESFDNSTASNTSALDKIVSPLRMSDSDVKPTLAYSPVSSSRGALAHPTSATVASMDKVEIAPGAEVGKNLDGVSRIYEVDGNTVIDLTEDEPANQDVKKIILEPNHSDIIIPQNEIVAVGPNNLLNKQKVNDQTASLRAVRIKAPSERNKSLSIDNSTGLKVTSQEQQTKSNILYMPEVDTNVDKAIDLDKTLAIQQAEISSTQHNTSVAGNCKYPLAISPSSTEYSGDESSKHVAQPSPMPVSEIGSQNIEEKKYDTPMPKTGMVTSSISSNAINRSNVDNSLKTIVDSNIAPTLPESCEVVTNDSILISKSKESDSPKGQVLDTAETNQMEDSIRSTKEAESEEDSEDDMSLAAIIKQKLREPVKTSIQNKKTIKQPKKKRKGKKGTQKNVRGETLEEIPLQNPTTECAESLPKQEENILQNDTTSKVVEIPDEKETDKHSKKRPRRGRRSVVTPATVPLDEVQTTESDKEINKENDVVSIMNNKTSSDNTMPLNVKSPIKELSPRRNDVVDDDVQIETTHIKTKLGVNRGSPNENDGIVRITKFSDSSPSATNKGQNKPKGKKKRLELSEGISVESVHHTEANETMKLVSDLNDIDRKVELETPKIHPHSDSLEQGSDSNTIINVADKKGKKPGRSKNQKQVEIDNVDYEVDTPQQVSNNYDDTNDAKTPTPLRRSRRGKSLYLESSTTEHDLSENTPEQKTPLTKKQLILSKLRLDEDTPKPSAHSTPENQNTSENALKHSSVKQAIDYPELSSIDNSCEVLDEAPKSKKRRINSQISKKPKKKKPVEEQNKPIKEINTDDSENNLQHSENVRDKRLSESSYEFKEITNERPQSPLLSTYKNATDTNMTSTEKRKINNQISFDLSQSSKPKKSKMSKNDNNLASNLSSLNTNKDFTTTTTTPETKTACYNVQVPSRRLRLKSAAPNESAESSDYDPYDINLEVMAEQNEFDKKNQSINKNSKKKTPISNVKESNKHNKGNRKTNKALNIPQDTKALSDYDSDNSTKSDVPLQKYIEEKVKRNKGVESISREKESKLSYRKDTKSVEDKRRRSSADDKTEVTQNDEDEQNEKFMQSFGFFSEKKPRKSNILATKKISETINITNESDDMYFGFKGKSKKHADKKSESDSSMTQPQPSTSKKPAARRGRKKKPVVERNIIPIPRACEMCRRNFKRSDNYLRHILSSIFHVSKVSETELKIKTQPVQDGPNYLVAYKLNLERYRNLVARHAELKNRSAKAAARIILPTHADLIEDVNETIEELQVLATRALSQDEELFLDCCELLQGADKGSFLDHFENAIEEEFAKLRECDDDDVDSITAQNILESEEVRNLENDLICGLKEAAASRDAKMNQEQVIDIMTQPQLQMQQVAAPQMMQPQEAIPELIEPQVDIPQIAISQVEIPQISIPQVKIPQIAVPQVDIPQMTMPEVEITEMAIPLVPVTQVPIPEPTMPEVAMPEVAMLEVQISQASQPQTTIPQVTIPEVAPMSPDVQNDQALLEDLEQAHEEAHDYEAPYMRLESDQEFQETQHSRAKGRKKQASSPVVDDCHLDSMDEFDIPIKCKMGKAKKPVKSKYVEEKYIEIKEKMYPDIIEDIDMFEDKFDKIKRKCRSQAAAAKQPQPVIEPTTSSKGRKKPEKKKGRKGSKKTVQQNTQVPTKGALKGFDGIKVSIPTSDINMSNIVPVYDSSPKKKKRSGPQRKKEIKDSEESDNYESDRHDKEFDASSTKDADADMNAGVDVYEFIDTEDKDVFEFRASTIMERLRSINHNKDMQNALKGKAVADDDGSSDSASDGDDFVYMSDDYVASDDETENSIMSCEISNAKIGNNDVKKISPQKRKDAMEKNAVMGKIFKNNALRTEKKIPVVKEPEQPKANLDQLFDSLLEEEPNSSVLNSEAMSPKDDLDDDLKPKYKKTSKYDTSDNIPDDQTSIDDSFISSQEPYSSSPEDCETISSDTVSKRRNSTPLKENTSKKKDTRSSKNYDTSEVNFGASTSKQYEPVIDYGPSTSKKYANVSPKDYKDLSPKSYDSISTNKYEEKYRHREPKSKRRNNSSSYKHDDETFKTFDEEAKSPASKPDEGISTSYDFNAEINDNSMDEDTGVARHRARRKCTVGKQNVLAEHWSSESEPDGGPPRPNSAESVLSCVPRKKRSRKKDGQQAGRRGSGRQAGSRKQDVEGRASGGRTACASVVPVPVSVGARRGSGGAKPDRPVEPAGRASASDKAVAAQAMPAPSTSRAGPGPGGAGAARGRRAGASYWAPGDPAQQEHQQQHGWIVGDSHKKLVTMLAYAKGRNRNDDELLDE